MRFSILILLICSLNLKAQTDKTLHVYAGVLISAVASNCSFYIFTDEKTGISLLIGGGAGAGAGIAKEKIYDPKFNGTNDNLDMFATFHGTFIGLIGCTVQFDLHKKKKHKKEYEYYQ